jgi:hypothetical protein
MHGTVNIKLKICKTKGYQAFSVTDKCVSGTSRIKIQLLENIYEMLYELRCGDLVKHGKN